MTWSAPKSVSVAWSQADVATRERIEHCLRRAAAAGVAYLQTVGGVSRRGEDGRVHEAARLVLAAFLHSTSRAQDPQLHLHTILLNVSVRADGTTGTLEPKDLYRHQMAAGTLFRAELAALLETELGLRARRENRTFELLGVDTELMAFFSKRRAQIEAELARLGQSGGRAAEIANFATRAVKEARPRTELFAEWQRIGHEHHWSAKELSWLIHAPLADAAGIPSTTLHRLLQQLSHGEVVLNDRTVVVLDEASMIGTRLLAQVVEHCARAGASLVLCGDSRQLQAIGLGGLFAELTWRFETSRLTEIQRQREEWARESVRHFAFGRAEQALLPYRQRGLVTETQHEVTAMDRMLADWRREALPDVTGSVMVTGTTAEVLELNRRAQAERRQLGLLGDTPVRVGPDTLFAGDRVLFTRNSPTLGVANGDLGTVTAAQDKSLSVRLDDCREVRIPVEGYPHLRLGYALSTHKAQGMTVERAFILTGGTLTDREMTYVQASRARGITRWYVGHDLDEVTQSMTRSHEKLAALSLEGGPELELTLSRSIG